MAPKNIDYGVNHSTFYDLCWINAYKVIIFLWSHNHLIEISVYLRFRYVKVWILFFTYGGFPWIWLHIYKFRYLVKICHYLCLRTVYPLWLGFVGKILFGGSAIPLSWFSLGVAVAFRKKHTNAVRDWIISTMLCKCSWWDFRKKTRAKNKSEFY